MGEMSSEFAGFDHLLFLASAEAVVIVAQSRDNVAPISPFCATRRSMRNHCPTVLQAGSLRLRVLWQFAKWRDAARRSVGFRAPGGMRSRPARPVRIPSMDGQFAEVVDYSMCHLPLNRQATPTPGGWYIPCGYHL
jgi:hypothetical protein